MKHFKKLELYQEDKKKMRCMLSKMMLIKANILIFDDNHLELEAITALNNLLISFKETILITSKDHKLIKTVCNRIIEIGTMDLIEHYIRLYV